MCAITRICYMKTNIKGLAVQPRFEGYNPTRKPHFQLVTSTYGVTHLKM